MNPTTRERKNLDEWLATQAVLLPLQEGYFAKVDAADYKRCCLHKWGKFRASGETCKVRMLTPHKQIPTKTAFGIALHRFILELETGDGYVRFNNGDGLDCRRSNMRVVPRVMPLTRAEPGPRVVQVESLPAPCGVMFKGKIGDRCFGFWAKDGECLKYVECLDRVIDQRWLGWTAEVRT
jgi:hypothetical protein